MEGLIYEHEAFGRPMFEAELDELMGPEARQAARMVAKFEVAAAHAPVVTAASGGRWFLTVGRPGCSSSYSAEQIVDGSVNLLVTVEQVGPTTDEVDHPAIEALLSDLDYELLEIENATGKRQHGLARVVHALWSTPCGPRSAGPRASPGRARRRRRRATSATPRRSP